MVRNIIVAAVSGVVLVISGFAIAAPRSIKLPDETAAFKPSSNPGYEATRDNCAACHSADYVNYQPSHMGQAFWNAEVHKMIGTFHADIGEEDAKQIVNYLSSTY